MIELKKIMGMCIILICAITVIYLQSLDCDFVHYDDNDYVFDNQMVKKGLTVEGVKWAFTHYHSANWHPITWLSHMLDCSLYDLVPSGHHWMNVELHMLNSILLFLLLYLITGALIPSACVAILFAIHPLHVESVAWISERKDCLSTCFALFTCLFYYHYTQHPTMLRFLIALGCYILGLMSKPMLVTLPCLLLLLDFWPLNRFKLPASKSIIHPSVFYNNHMILLEKIPFLIFALMSCFITIQAQQSFGAVMEILPLTIRLSNALVSYVTYIYKTIFPFPLSIFYPHLGNQIPFFQVITALLCLIGITGVCIKHIRTYPYLTVGWLWYLGTLVPVIGIIQVGAQSMADRYTYIPSIGLFIMVVWGSRTIIQNYSMAKEYITIIFIIFCLGFMIKSYSHMQTWRNTNTLFNHVILTFPNNHIGYKMMGDTQYVLKNNLRALDYYMTSLMIYPKNDDLHARIAVVFMELGQSMNASKHFKESLRINPENADVHYNFGLLCLQQNQAQQALDHFKKTVSIKPDHAKAYNNIGLLFVQMKHYKQAKAFFKNALHFKPNYKEAQHNLKQLNVLCDSEKCH